MKGAPLRIFKFTPGVTAAAFEGGDYVEAVTKLIPGAVVAAYLSGRSILLAGAGTDTDKWWAGTDVSKWWWVGWATFGLLAVIILRVWTTSDEKAGVPPEWSSIIISAVSFVVWVYNFGDAFKLFGLWSEVGSGLLLIGWTLIAPAVLKMLKSVLGR
jgi:hypothetical protein